MLRDLLECYKEGKHRAYVYATNNKPEPLCAIYTSKGLKHIIDLHTQKKLAKFSMMYVLECIFQQNIFLYADTSVIFFANYNSNEDLFIK